MARTTIPPSVEAAPVELQAELMAMQTYPIATLREIALSQIPRPKQERQRVLLVRSQAEPLSELENHELEELQRKAERLTVRKAYALAVLQWRGEPLPGQP